VAYVKYLLVFLCFFRFGRLATLRNHVVTDHGIADAVTEKMTFVSPAEVNAAYGHNCCLN